MRAGEELEGVFGGAVAGVAATIAMSGVLAVAARAGLLQEPPPRAIVRRALPGLSSEAVNALAVVAHIGYGAAAGVVHRTVLGAPGPAGSVLYGLGLWGVSYEGWVPVEGALPPAHLDDRRRQGSMVAAHVVYGLALGLLARRRRQAAALRASSSARRASSGNE